MNVLVEENCWTLTRWRIFRNSGFKNASTTARTKTGMEINAGRIGFSHQVLNSVPEFPFASIVIVP
jgi:hypothetical protein